MTRPFRGTINLDIRDSKPDWDAFLGGVIARILNLTDAPVEKLIRGRSRNARSVPRGQQIAVLRQAVGGQHGAIAGQQTESSYIPNLKTIYDTAPPTAGIWQAGDKVWHSTPSPEGTTGWVCVAGGTPGTWKEFGPISG